MFRTVGVAKRNFRITLCVCVRACVREYTSFMNVLYGRVCDPACMRYRLGKINYVYGYRYKCVCFCDCKICCFFVKKRSLVVCYCLGIT